MADHVELNAGSGGSTVWADECSAVKVQGVKLIAGGDGTAQMGTTLATSYLTCANTTNATSVKGSAGILYGYTVTNTSAAVAFLRFYNKASAPTVGSDTVVHCVAVPGATTGAGIAHYFPLGLGFSTGIAFSLTTGAADTDTTAIAAANTIKVNIHYV